MSDTRGDWTRYLDESSQRFYYWNSQSDVTTWDEPEAFKKAAPVAAAAEGKVRGRVGRSE